MITSDGKAIAKKNWGGLPNAFGDGHGDSEGEEESSEEESSDEEMEESEEEGEMEAPPRCGCARPRSGNGFGASRRSRQRRALKCDRPAQAW